MVMFFDFIINVVFRQLGIDSKKIASVFYIDGCALSYFQPQNGSLELVGICFGVTCPTCKSQ
jgi:hypothetical protein